MDTVSPHAQDDNTPKKQCKGPCGRWLPATSEFFKVHYKAKDGLVNKCRQCRDVVRICGVCGSQKTKRIVSGESRSVCKECERRHAREFARRKGPQPITDTVRATKARHRKKVRASGLTNSRVYRLRAIFGLDEEDYLRMLESQHGCCAICQGPFTKGVRIDHDHKTGEVRGLLCQWCNTGLGYFTDNPEKMRRAAMYIETWKERLHGEL